MAANEWLLSSHRSAGKHLCEYAVCNDETSETLLSAAATAYILLLTVLGCKNSQHACLTKNHLEKSTQVKQVATEE